MQNGNKLESINIEDSYDTTLVKATYYPERWHFNHCLQNCITVKNSSLSFKIQLGEVITLPHYGDLTHTELKQILLRLKIGAFMLLNRSNPFLRKKLRKDYLMLQIIYLSYATARYHPLDHLKLCTVNRRPHHHKLNFIWLTIFKKKRDSTSKHKCRKKQQKRNVSKSFSKSTMEQEPSSKWIKKNSKNEVSLNIRLQQLVTRKTSVYISIKICISSNKISHQKTKLTKEKSLTGDSHVMSHEPCHNILK